MSISRFTFAMAVVASSLLTVPARAEDLAATVASKLRESGALVGYRVNVKAKAGTVWLEGTVSDDKQIAAAVGVAETTPGVERVVNRLVVNLQDEPSQPPLGVPSSAWNAAGLATPEQQPAAAEATAPAKKPALNPLAFVAEALFPAKPSAPTDTSRSDVQLVAAAAPGKGRGPQRAGPPAGMQPRSFAGPSGRPAPVPGGRSSQYRTAMRTSGVGEPMTLPGPGGLQDGQMVPGSMQYSDGGYAAGPGAMPQGPGMGGPMPMAGTGVGMPPVPMRADGPNMPKYAWPSYAAYPNYAALQYPTQYSPTAWPYIGPFYPYPQVPLGWRRVSLEWDDGWWWLDFDERHYHTHHK